MQPLSVDSVLDAVTVYAEGAICCRLAKLTLPEPAPFQLRLVGLPLSLVEGSLRAAVRSGPAGLRVCDVRPGFDVVLPGEADLPAEQRALEEARDALQRLELEREVLNRELACVAALRPSFPKRRKGDPPRPAPLNATLALAAFVDERLGELYRREEALTARMEDARNEVELRTRRVWEASGAKRAERARLIRTALVTLSQPGAAGPVELELEYLVPGATWAPSYELRLDRAMKQGTLAMRACVAQRTGEDWKGVRLGLSTANLDRRIEVPELKSLRIGKSQPPAPRSGWRDPPPGLAELFTGFDGAAAKRPTGAPKPAPEPLPPSSPPRVQAEAPAYGRAGYGPEVDEDEGGMYAGEAAAEPEESLELADMMDASLPPPGGAGGARPMPAPKAGAAIPRQAAVARSAAAPPPMMAPAPAMRRMEKERAKKRSVTREVPAASLGGGPADVLSPAPEPELELSAGLLDYGNLAMAGPEEPGARGKLRPIRETELELFSRISVHVEVTNLVRVRQQEAAGVAGLTRPPHAGNVRALAGSYDYRYDAERRVDVEADGGWHTVPVFTADVGILPGYVCVPSVDPKVYRTVKLVNRSKHALLAGPVDITLGDEFLMTAPFPSLAPGGEERVGLGVEEGIKVSRNTRFNEATGGLLGGAAVLNHAVEIEVANRLLQAVDVEVLERVPFTLEKDIKLEEGPVQPPWAVEDKPRNGVLVQGTRAWRLKLEASEQKKLSAQYAIRIPGQKALVGGNRRV